MTMTYAVLTAAKSTSGSIKNWVNHDSIPADAVLEDAQALIYARLRVREMLTTTAGTASASSSTLTLPTTLLAARSLRITGTDAATIRGTSPEQVEREMGYDGTGLLNLGKPGICYFDKVQAVFPVRCDQSYPVRLLYYERPAPLSSTNTTNFLTDSYARLLRTACAAVAAEWKKEWDVADRYLARLNDEIATVNAASDMDLGLMEAK